MTLSFIFQISSVNSFDYHVATLIGLLPAQAINVYLGSKLRSIHDVINDNHTALAGYGMFIFEVSEIVHVFYFHFYTRFNFRVIYFNPPLTLHLSFSSIKKAIVGVSLMMWVIHKAKSELAAALLDSIDVDEKLLIEVDV